MERGHGGLASQGGGHRRWLSLSCMSHKCTLMSVDAITTDTRPGIKVGNNATNLRVHIMTCSCMRPRHLADTNKLAGHSVHNCQPFPPAQVVRAQRGVEGVANTCNKIACVNQSQTNALTWVVCHTHVQPAAGDPTRKFRIFWHQQKRNCIQKSVEQLTC